MKIIICGGKHFNSYEVLEFVADKIIDQTNLLSEVEIVSGHCPGADMLGERYAIYNGYKLKVFPAEWEKYGRAAGPIRNKQMVDYIKDDEKPVVIAFVSPKTRGTRNTVELAKKEKITVVQVPYIPEDIPFDTTTKDYIFNWDTGSSEDIVKLTKDHICIQVDLPTGESFRMVIDLLRDNGYTGEIQIFSLMDNR